MPSKKNAIRLPSPSNINPPTKGISNLKKRICTELSRNGRFGAKKQVVHVRSESSWDYEPSRWMAELLDNPRAIRFLREQLNRDFIQQGWYVTWLEQRSHGYKVKMTYRG